MGKDYVCNKCGYQWASRKGQGEPAYCPRCASKRIEVNNSETVSATTSTELTKCDYCGRLIQSKDVAGECQYVRKGFFKTRCIVKEGGGCLYDHATKRYRFFKQLCKKCAKECKKCDKIFCPEHIDSHTCK